MDVFAPLAIDDRRSPKVPTHGCVGTSGDRRSPEVPRANIKVFGSWVVATIGVKQHIVGAIVLGCVWVWRHTWRP